MGECKYTYIYEFTYRHENVVQWLCQSYLVKFLVGVINPSLTNPTSSSYVSASSIQQMPHLGKSFIR